jgi:hypothetical protein
MNTELDSLLDTTLDDIADLPSFEPFHPGAHKALATFSTKDINGKAAIELSFKLMETIELADTTMSPQDPGSEASTMFLLGNEFGIGNLKKVAAPFAEAMGFTSIRDIVDGVKDVEVVVVTSVRTDKNDKDKKYLQVKEIAVV